MAKKKKKSSTWLRKEINTKLSSVFILSLFLLCVLITYTYSIPSVGIPIESQIQINFQNFIQSLTPTPPTASTPTPIKIVGTPLPVWSTPAPHGQITIPPADCLNNSYQYYDANLDATFYIPNSWTIYNDPSNAGMGGPNPPRTIGETGGCYQSWARYFKDFSQCQNTYAYGLTITRPNPSRNERYSIVLMGVSNGFGGSCNWAVNSGQMKIYDVSIAINNNAYVLTTYRGTGILPGDAIKSTGSYQNTGAYFDCYAWPVVHESGHKSPWAAFIVRHYAPDDKTFIIEMQILENIKFHQ